MGKVRGGGHILKSLVNAPNNATMFSTNMRRFANILNYEI